MMRRKAPDSYWKHVLQKWAEENTDITNIEGGMWKGATPQQ